MPDKLSLKIINFAEVDSTNSRAFSLGLRGAGEILVIKAASQTKGKGRLGRHWVSIANKGIYASFLLRPANSFSDISLLPLFFALGIARSISSFVPVRIKWPNDVIVGRCKISGVLAEARSGSGCAEFVVVGLGINVSCDKKDLPAGATSLFIETGAAPVQSKIFNDLIKEEINIYKEFKKGNIRQLLRESKVFLDKETFSKENCGNYPFLRELFSDRGQAKINEKFIKNTVMFK